METIKDIFNQDKYKALNENLKHRISTIEKQEQEQNRKKQELEKLTLKERRKIMDFVNSIYSEELCQNYLKLNKKFKVYNFNQGYAKNLFFDESGILLSYKEGLILPLYAKIKFNEGYAIKDVSCGMGGSRKMRFSIESLVEDFEIFKKEVIKNVRETIKNTQI